ncbi:hypothetical protein BpHYR1_014036 [Brachionus plicatilis]|uniref:Uncharacterized protein n=1 Tax=Brachionus plicatilis TaxID=10195 RepID=A0A3M7PCJ6_BRAPC|nr:hypothetical protein BpHYR1_014036 [Brachionus plicatilis]
MFIADKNNFILFFFKFWSLIQSGLIFCLILQAISYLKLNSLKKKIKNSFRSSYHKLKVRIYKKKQNFDFDQLCYSAFIIGPEWANLPYLIMLEY